MRGFPFIIKKHKGGIFLVNINVVCYTLDKETVVIPEYYMNWCLFWVLKIWEMFS